MRKRFYFFADFFFFDLDHGYGVALPGVLLDLVLLYLAVEVVVAALEGCLERGSVLLEVLLNILFLLGFLVVGLLDAFEGILKVEPLAEDPLQRQLDAAGDVPSLLGGFEVVPLIVPHLVPQGVEGYRALPDQVVGPEIVI